MLCIPLSLASRFVLFHQVSKILANSLIRRKTAIFRHDLTFQFSRPYLFGNLVSSPQIEVGQNEPKAVLRGRNIRGGREIQTLDAKRRP